MKAAGIIAAGLGERLAAARLGVPKPMAPVAGRPLCHWVVSGLRAAGVTDVTLLTNTRGLMIRGSLEKAFPDLSWTFLCADTASSWESFRLVASRMREERFLMSTVDALIPPREVARFSVECGPLALALTRFVDDEKPLRAELGPDGLIARLGAGPLVTAGLYAMNSRVEWPAAGAFGSLREFLGALVGKGGVRGIELSKTLDVDRPEDLAAAESFLKENASVW